MNTLLGQLSNIIGKHPYLVFCYTTPSFVTMVNLPNPVYKLYCYTFNVQYPPYLENIELHCRIDEVWYFFKGPVQVI